MTTTTAFILSQNEIVKPLYFRNAFIEHEANDRMNQRICLIIIREKKALVILRQKKGYVYVILPGGGVEAGETLEQAAVREAKEETGCEIILGKHLFDVEFQGRIGRHFLTELKGTPVLGDPEAARNCATNSYELAWVSREELAGMNLVPKEAKEKVMELLQEKNLIHKLNS